jgi:hypothetical protein
MLLGVFILAILGLADSVSAATFIACVSTQSGGNMRPAASNAACIVSHAGSSVLC